MTQHTNRHFLDSVAQAHPRSPSNSETTEPQIHSEFSFRIADVAAIDDHGQQIAVRQKIPATPLFDAAFAAFGQGTLFKAEDGEVAVEDLLPGDLLVTSCGRKERINWIGSTVFTPLDPGKSGQMTLVTPESIGMNRPYCNLNLGSAARLLKTPPEFRGRHRAASTMTKADQFCDGVSIVKVVPQIPVRLFHLVLDRHSAILANGVELESFHPGSNPEIILTPSLRDAFLAMFPHIDNFSEFGPMNFHHAEDAANTG